MQNIQEEGSSITFEGVYRTKNPFLIYHESGKPVDDFGRSNPHKVKISSTKFFSEAFKGAVSSVQSSLEAECKQPSTPTVGVHDNVCVEHRNQRNLLPPRNALMYLVAGPSSEAFRPWYNDICVSER
jgi:hypothetical protein